MAKNAVLRSMVIESVLKGADSMPLTRKHIKGLIEIVTEMRNARILLSEYIETAETRLDYRPCVPMRKRKSKQGVPQMVGVPQDELDKELDDNPVSEHTLAEIKAQDEWTNRKQ